MASNIQKGIKAFTNLMVKDISNPVMPRVLVLPTPDAVTLAPGIEEAISRTRSELGTLVIDDIDVNSEEPTLTCTFPRKTPELIALRLGRRITTGNVTTTVEKKTIITAGNRVGPGAGPGREGHGMPADQAGSIASYFSDAGFSVPLTRADFATFNAATPDRFAQGANGAYLVSDNVLGREVTFSFPIALPNVTLLGEEPFRDFEMHLAFVTRSLEVGKLIIGKANPSVAEGDLDMAAPALPITFRVVNDGQNCQLYRIVWFGQVRACG